MLNGEIKVDWSLRNGALTLYGKMEIGGSQLIQSYLENLNRNSRKCLSTLSKKFDSAPTMAHIMEYLEGAPS